VRKWARTKTQGKGIEGQPDEQPALEVTALEDSTGDKIAPVDRAKIIEETKEAYRKITNTSTTELAGHILGQMASVMVGHTFGGEVDRAFCVLSAMKDLKSGDLGEALLAVQMTGTHFLAVKFLRDAAFKEQTAEGCDANVLRATRLMRVFNEQLEAMAKLKGKTGQQKVTVEHVHVNAGGQAIVGTVTSGKKDQGEGGQ
jgi:hypothetical protein